MLDKRKLSPYNDFKTKNASLFSRSDFQNYSQCYLGRGITNLKRKLRMRSFRKGASSYLALASLFR